MVIGYALTMVIRHALTMVIRPALTIDIDHALTLLKIRAKYGHWACCDHGH